MNPVFTILFVLFVVIFTIYVKRWGNHQEEITNSFWEKERQANIVRKQDISKLDYITVPKEQLSSKVHSTAENTFMQAASKKMLNLNGMTNTEVKLAYGTANLAELSEYDEAYSEYIASIPAYAQELIDASYIDAAKEILFFAIKHGADSKKIYEQLASIYHNEKNFEEIHHLEDYANELSSNKERILSFLDDYLKASAIEEIVEESNQ